MIDAERCWSQAFHSGARISGPEPDVWFISATALSLQQHWQAPSSQMLHISPWDYYTIGFIFFISPRYSRAPKIPKWIAENMPSSPFPTYNSQCTQLPSLITALGRRCYYRQIQVSTPRRASRWFSMNAYRWDYLFRPYFHTGPLYAHHFYLSI